ncbi:hypothetical protein JCM5296_003782 [Sporobolomyces johnsonii]
MLPVVRRFAAQRSALLASNLNRPTPSVLLPLARPSCFSLRTMASVSASMERFLADRDPPVCSLKIADTFKALTNEEKLYSHYLSEASWAGGRIIMRQTTFHAERLFDLVVGTFSAATNPKKLADLAKIKNKSGVSDEEWNEVLAYCAQVLSNLSNFKSFGATKFIPRASEAAFEAVVNASERADVVKPLFNELKSEIYALSPEPALTIGNPNAGHLSSYYPSSPPPSDAQVNEVQAICDAAGVSTLNTRLSRVSDQELILHIASVSDLPSSFPKSLKSEKLGFEVKLQPGDYSDCLAKVNAALREARKYAGDKNRAGMLADYEESFEHGDVEAHKEGSRKWVKDQGPVVESYIGYIEDYVDPYGGRAEWEGFVAVVNKEQSQKFNVLVDSAAELIKDLPWPSSYEVPEFKRPDFTALEILAFATSGIPAGINIPNYHDVRENDGFKNVSLSNILSAKAANEVFTFIAPEDLEAYEKWEGKAFEVQVANHELLGHGTGRLFQANADGTLPFDPEKIINPLTGKPITSWYKPGETYGSRIGPVSSSMEECRAEAVALYLASNREILSIFKYETDQDANDLTYWTFVVMVRAGIRALEWYDPATQRHGQAHMEARLGITNWLIDHGLASIEEKVDPSTGELVDAYARVDRDAVLKRGKEVMGKLLLEIQVRKSTGDGPGATEFYKKLTKPSDHWVEKLRPLVLAKKLPRKIFVQPTTSINAATGEVELKEYPVTVEGVIESFIERGL